MEMTGPRTVPMNGAGAGLRIPGQGSGKIRIRRGLTIDDGARLKYNAENDRLPQAGKEPLCALH